MDRPKAVQLATYRDGTKGVWALTNTGIAYLEGLKDELCVVGISGTMRTGKSYIMNLLADPSFPEEQIELFDLGSTVESKTRGIWAYARPIPPRTPGSAPQTLLILDFEGMHDPSGQRENGNFDPQVFLLAVLLSSYFVYNCLRCIDKDQLDKLAFVANVGEHLLIDATSVDSGFEGVGDVICNQFPSHFSWVVRDFHLTSVDGTEVTDARAYLEEQLRSKPNPGKKKDVKERNDLLSAIRDNFKNRSCHLLPIPIFGKDSKGRDKIAFIAEQPFSSLSAEFRQKIRVLIDEILRDVTPKRIKDPKGNSAHFKTSGREFCAYASALFEQVNTTSVFCVEDAWSNVSKAVTRSCFVEAIAIYEAECSGAVGEGFLETDLLNSRLAEASERAQAVYIASAIKTLKDDSEIGFSALQARFEVLTSACIRRNLEASQQEVSRLVDEMIGQLMVAIESRQFADNAGYQERKKELRDAIGKYKGKVGPAWNGMAEGLVGRFVDTDKLAAMIFQLSDKEIEIQEELTRNRLLLEQNMKVELELKDSKIQAKAMHESFIKSQQEMQTAHEEEMKMTRLENQARMKQLEEETADALRRGERALAEEKMASQARLSAAISDLDGKHADELARMERNHRNSLNDMEANQKSLELQMKKVQADAAEQENKNKETMEKYKQEADDARAAAARDAQAASAKPVQQTVVVYGFPWGYFF